MHCLTKITALAALCAAFGSAGAAPVKYTIDPAHTFPSFDADHQGGLSIWRGKFKKSSGTVMLDREAKSGTIDVTVDIDSIDFGNDKLNTHAKTPDIFDATTYPTATYKGNLVFTGDTPTAVDGFLTLHGVTKPVKMTINQFLCRTNPQTKVETCGADALANFNREDFGVAFGKPLFKMDVILRIQVEAKRDQPAT
jgi:polyisoprenoid-binding protein YceI